MRWGVVGVVVLATTAAGCGLFGRASAPLPPERGATEVGVASWYGPGFHGKATTSGEIYDQRDLTAAHPSLPLGTRVAVTNLDNGKQVEVRVNDRGPFAKSRVIDLSYAAARTLDMIGPGTARVRIEVLDGSAARFAPLTYTVQVGSFGDRDNAARLKRMLEERFEGVYLSALDGSAGRYYRVRIGRFARHDDAVQFARSMAPLGLPAIIVEDGNAP
jgi:peptidoglycan lytic transglycosylase